MKDMNWTQYKLPRDDGDFDADKTKKIEINTNTSKAYYSKRMEGRYERICEEILYKGRFFSSLLSSL